MNALLHTMFLIAAAAAIAAVCRDLWRRHRLVGAIVSIGVVLRLAVGFGMLVVSSRNLPVFRALHTGDGFWAIAPDARVYFALASEAANHGLSVIKSGSPSPFFVAMLGLWFRAAGVSLGNAVLFNVAAYVVTSLACVLLLPSPKDRHHFGALLLLLAALTFSPTLLFASGQALKDALFTLVAVLACGAIVRLVHLIAAGQVRLPTFAVAVVLTAVGVYGIAGTRTYYALIVFVAFVISLVAAISVAPAGQRIKGVASGVCAACLIWVAFMTGGGLYYEGYRNLIETVTAVPLPHYGTPSDASRWVGRGDLTTLGDTVGLMRRGFARTGGATNLASESENVEYVPHHGLQLRRRFALMLSAGCAAVVLIGVFAMMTGGRIARRVFGAVGLASISVAVLAYSGAAGFTGNAAPLMQSARTVAHAIGVGLAAMFVPVSLLRETGLLAVNGGRGFLIVTDLDTVFLDLSLIAVLLFALGNRTELAARRAVVLFLCVVGVLATALIAYIVTNFGTLVRVRLLAVVPIWLIPVAMALQNEADIVPCGAASTPNAAGPPAAL